MLTWCFSDTCAETETLIMYMKMLYLVYKDEWNGSNVKFCHREPYDERFFFFY